MKLKLYIWKGLPSLQDYGPGEVVVMAHSVDEAIEVACRLPCTYLPEYAWAEVKPRLRGDLETFTPEAHEKPWGWVDTGSA